MTCQTERRNTDSSVKTLVIGELVYHATRLGTVEFRAGKLYGVELREKSENPCSRNLSVSVVSRALGATVASDQECHDGFTYSVEGPIVASVEERGHCESICCVSVARTD